MSSGIHAFEEARGNDQLAQIKRSFGAGANYRGETSVAALLQNILQKLGKEARHLNLEIKIEMSELRFFEQFFRSG